MYVGIYMCACVIIYQWWILTRGYRRGGAEGSRNETVILGKGGWRWFGEDEGCSGSFRVYRWGEVVLMTG